jgi:hypothetical protein
MRYLDDVLVVLGCILIVGATASWSLLAAVYVAGGILILAGIVVSMAERLGPK